jgi:hypothetical protein
MSRPESWDHGCAVSPGPGELPSPPVLPTAGQLRETVLAIAAVQQGCGAVPWPDGHTDPWDHVECLMALTVGGLREEARAGYRWLRQLQAADGSWAMSYDGTRVLDASVDANQCAYIAVGVWQWWLVTKDLELPTQLWPTVRRALDLVVDLQQPTGHVSWGRSPAGSVAQGALLTGSSSIFQALRCGIALAELVGEPQPEWELAVGLLQHAVVSHREMFLPKERYSMDWYYPVLGGAIRGAAAADMLAQRWDEFVIAGYGARCVSDRPWVTGAETAELALALMVSGEVERARSLLAEIQCLRGSDGSYWTGLVVDDGLYWPVEASSWTSAAIVLACDALAGGTTLQLFAGTDLPSGVPIPSDVCRRHDAPCAVAAAGSGR